MLARSTPSTSTLTVPSGSFSSCRMVATVPTRYRSSALGSSTSACFWATSRIRLSDFMARSSATIDFSRPTNSGITMCGYTTTSRSGSTGTAVDTTASVTADSLGTAALFCLLMTGAAFALDKNLWGRPAPFQGCAHKTTSDGGGGSATGSSAVQRTARSPRFLDGRNPALVHAMDDVGLGRALDDAVVHHHFRHVA